MLNVYIKNIDHVFGKYQSCILNHVKSSMASLSSHGSGRRIRMVLLHGGGTIDLNKLLSLNLEERGVMKLRFTEYNNLLVLCIDFGLFTIQLQSLHFKVLAQGR